MNVSTAHAKLLEEWIADLRRVMPELQDWWDQMVRDAGPGGDRIVRARWPSGPASHPRVISLFRDYYFRVEALNHTIEESEPAEGAGWGQDTPDALAGPVPPIVLLLQMIAGEAPDAAEFLRYFDFIPVGEDLDLETC
ncbi:hypothetical protein QKW60_14120 [Defluviimonas aestuarii]|uniref:hypothetical protein n=1 Tax=Albidovulum aestuarii TaxID=1130726 RepID=UPI00249AFC7C|nr:hypothetical protein [Defluviimonas aestuarii]MDI3337550.1 hypothetical protein [Defluviimonas aestuarii]